MDMVVDRLSRLSKGDSLDTPSDLDNTPLLQDIRIKQSRILHSILLIMESVLFGMFVIAIACDQFEAIFSDETLVEQAKKQVSSPA